jgi:hypothetical protein
MPFNNRVFSYYIVLTLSMVRCTFIAHIWLPASCRTTLNLSSFCSSSTILKHEFCLENNRALVVWSHTKARGKIKQILSKSNTILQHLLHCVNLSVCFTFAIYVQLQLIFILLLFIVTITCFSLIGHHQSYKLLCWRYLLFCFSFVTALGCYVGIMLLPCVWCLGASASTKTFKTATHRTEEESTNQQNHQLNSCMATARYQHNNSPRQLQ